MNYNILISTIKDFDSHTTTQYNYITTDNGHQFCESMAAGEAGAKNILSKVMIDEIIAIGSIQQELQTHQSERVLLREGIDFYSADIEKMSDFDFFRYRLMQYIKEIDIEAADLYGNVEKLRQQEIVEIIHEVFGKQADLALEMIIQKPTLWKEFEKKAGTLTVEELEWSKRYLFHALFEANKITAMTQNADIPISFVPISNLGFDKTSMNHFHQLSLALMQGKTKEDEIHLYVDMNGFSHEESYIFMSMLQALSANSANNIMIEEITSISELPKGFIYKITNARDRYKVEMLLSGINAFINYGKVDILRKYWKSANIKNDYIDKFLYAMDTIDAAMTLCYIDELEKGIKMLRTILHQEFTVSDEDEEENFILALRAGIINDYGALVEEEGDEIDLLALVKWAFSKGFYQQAITIIESKLPQDMVKRGILYYAQTDAEKEAYLKALNAHFWDAHQKERYIFQNISHYFIKYYSRYIAGYRSNSENKNMEYAMLRAEQVFESHNEMLKAYSLIEDRDKFIEMMFIYYEICGFRNNMNHAAISLDEQDMSNDYSGETPIKKMFREGLGDFIAYYEKVCDSISGKPFVSKTITPEEFGEYTRAHGPKFDTEWMNVEGYIRLQDRKKRLKSEGEKKDS